VSTNGHTTAYADEFVDWAPTRAFPVYPLEISNSEGFVYVVAGIMLVGLVFLVLWPRERRG
jgi:hypothetical protein